MPTCEHGNIATFRLKGCGMASVHIGVLPSGKKSYTVRWRDPLTGCQRGKRFKTNAAAKDHAAVMHTLVLSDRLTRSCKEKVEPALEVAKSRSPQNHAVGTVYFLRHPFTGLIKIGVTTGSVEHRKRNIEYMCGHDLELLATQPGGRVRERFLHQWLHQSRVRGEWFRETDRLLDVMSGRTWSDGAVGHQS